MWRGICTHAEHVVVEKNSYEEHSVRHVHHADECHHGDLRGPEEHNAHLVHDSAECPVRRVTVEEHLSERRHPIEAAIEWKGDETLNQTTPLFCAPNVHSVEAIRDSDDEIRDQKNQKCSVHAAPPGKKAIIF